MVGRSVENEIEIRADIKTRALLSLSLPKGNGSTEVINGYKRNPKLGGGVR